MEFREEDFDDLICGEADYGEEGGTAYETTDLIDARGQKNLSIIEYN